MSTWVDDYIRPLDDREAREERLTDWERGIVDSQRRQIEAGQWPTGRQSDTLDEVRERATKRG